MQIIWSICDKNFNLVRPALQFSLQKCHIWSRNYEIFDTSSKFWYFCITYKRNRYFFYLKWAWNECLHLRTSEMSIDMGRRIVHCTAYKLAGKGFQSVRIQLLSCQIYVLGLLSTIHTENLYTERPLRFKLLQVDNALISWKLVTTSSRSPFSSSLILCQTDLFDPNSVCSCNQSVQGRCHSI